MKFSVFFVLSSICNLNSFSKQPGKVIEICQYVNVWVLLWYSNFQTINKIILWTFLLIVTTITYFVINPSSELCNIFAIKSVCSCYCLPSCSGICVFLKINIYLLQTLFNVAIFLMPIEQLSPWIFHSIK